MWRIVIVIDIYDNSFFKMNNNNMNNSNGINNHNNYNNNNNNNLNGNNYNNSHGNNYLNGHNNLNNNERVALIRALGLTKDGNPIYKIRRVPIT